MQGCFAQMEELCVYSAWEEDKNQWTEQWFPAKMAAASLLRLSTRYLMQASEKAGFALAGEGKKSWNKDGQAFSFNDF